VASQLRNMNGPLSYYRTTKIRFEEEKGQCIPLSVLGIAETRFLFVGAQLPGQLPAALPVLHIWGGKDPTATPRRVLSRMRETTPTFEEISLPDKGHWIMAQAGEVVTGAVLRWLSQSRSKL
jgi:pimeloyl-ACP methyl ester carboxylesterase